jgi:hypothetical protein
MHHEKPERVVTVTVHIDFDAADARVFEAIKRSCGDSEIVREVAKSVVRTIRAMGTHVQCVRAITCNAGFLLSESDIAKVLDAFLGEPSGTNLERFRDLVRAGCSPLSATAAVQARV